MSKITKKYTGRWFWILSPTYKYAERKKKALLKSLDGSNQVTDAIRRYNHFYFVVSVLLALVCGVLFWDTRRDDSLFWGLRTGGGAIFFGCVVFSRATEIFVAFLLDAIEKLNGHPSASKLEFGDRLLLALKSYLELMLGFGSLYYLLPNVCFKGGFKNIIEAIYFSAITMTTVGYGDITPQHWLSQALVILQIFCSLILALVCFTVYTTLALAGLAEKK